MILGLMMGFDMGGPVNKTAYVFAAARAGRRDTGAACRSWPPSWPPA